MKTVNKLALADSVREILAVSALLWTTAQLSAQSPYIDRVYYYMPAPGQFVNTMPAYTTGDTQADMNRKVEELIAGTHHNEGMITLGGYGGYVVFGFDHEVMNVAGKYDFRILGNAFYASDNPNGEASREGGSSEPGIVMVSRDENGNGLPDDPWYELAGSDYRRPTTIHNYRITYYRPDENKTPVPHPSERHVFDMEYVRWTTNGHGNGYVYRNDYHFQPYYPLWAEGDELVFEGARLADNGIDESGRGAYYVLYASHWGYADNQPNDNPRSGFNIEWAVDASGNPVALEGIHFVKVYTAVNQNCGWIGEVSTEISGAEDLHLTGRGATVPVFANGVTLNRTSVELHPGETVTLTAAVAPENATNRNITWRSDNTAVATVGATGTVAAGTAVIQAVAAGTAVIQAIANDGYYIDECQVVVQANTSGPEPPPSSVPVTGVTLSAAQLELKPGETWNLAAVVTPQNATNKSVAWQSSTPSVAEVTVSGKVVAFSAGTATITVTTTDGGHKATCDVTVALPSDNMPVARPKAHVSHDGNTLRLRGLEGFDCRLVTPGGQTLATFRCASPDETRRHPLPPGIYILAAQKQGERKTFKIIAGK